MIILETKRLILRIFKDEDLDPMAQINQDPKVMEYFPAVGDKEQTRTHIKRINDHYAKYGFSLYAVEIKETGEFIGFVGLLHRELDEFDASFMPATEIGWRLSSKHWGKGYAPEASKAVLEYAFNTLNLKEVVSFTSVGNQKSIRVMEKIGLKHYPDDNFYHPKLDKDHTLALHVLYKLSKEDYLNKNKTIILFSSSRENGNTKCAVDIIRNNLDCDFIDLTKLTINDFDYDFKNKDDDFIPLIKQILEYDTIILASPVYWYSMSAGMKRFVDRLSDLLSYKKGLGRKLRNKNLAVITSYINDPKGYDGFEKPFINTAEYMSLNYLGCFFYYSGENKSITLQNKTKAQEFLQNIQGALTKT